MDDLVCSLERWRHLETMDASHNSGSSNVLQHEQSLSTLLQVLEDLKVNHCGEHVLWRQAMFNNQFLVEEFPAACFRCTWVVPAFESAGISLNGKGSKRRICVNSNYVGFPAVFVEKLASIIAERRTGHSSELDQADTQIDDSPPLSPGQRTASTSSTVTEKRDMSTQTSFTRCTNCDAAGKKVKVKQQKVRRLVNKLTTLQPNR